MFKTNADLEATIKLMENAASEVENIVWTLNQTVDLMRTAKRSAQSAFDQMSEETKHSDRGAALDEIGFDFQDQVDEIRHISTLACDRVNEIRALRLRIHEYRLATVKSTEN